MLKNVLDTKVIKRLLFFASRYRLLFITTALISILLAFVASVRPYLVIKIVDDYIVTKQNQQLLYQILFLGFVLMVEFSLQLFFMYFSNWLGQYIVKDIRIKIFKHILQFKMSHFNESPVGRMVTRVVSDVETIAQFFGQGFFMILGDILKMSVVAGFMLYTHWQLAIISFSTLPLLLYATKLFQRLIKVTFQQVRTQIANLNSFVQEHITGMKIVQLFVREQDTLQKFQKINQIHRKAHIKTVWYFSIFFPVAEILASVSVGLLVWFGGLSVVIDGSVSCGQVIGFIMMSEMLFRPLRQIADKFTTLQMGIVAADRVFTILDTEQSIAKQGTITGVNLKGNIEFKNVWFSYKSNESILKGISLQISAGETLAIVGTTGAGKSTLINLLNRFYEIDKGAILIDKININDYTLDILRGQIAVVLQDVFLFSDTILNNITLKNPNISLQQVRKAAQTIGIHDFITSLPNGYHHNVKERGQMLSSGQGQLIAFLRAYVSNPSILILDEATSSIDNHSEAMIQYATKQITKNRTSIVIAHRLATVQNADRIIVMSNGNIVEQGSHKELIQNEEGFYYHLYHKQFEKI